MLCTPLFIVMFLKSAIKEYKVYVFLGAIDLLFEGRRAAHSDAAEQLFIAIM
jgi:hypothetical protein